jgi:hypothetical protein
VSQSSLSIDPSTAREVIKIVARGRGFEGFGNAGAVEVLSFASLSLFPPQKIPFSDKNTHKHVLV